LDWIASVAQNGCALPATLSVKVVGTIDVVVDVVGGPGGIEVVGVVTAGVLTGNVRGLAPPQLSMTVPGDQARVVCVSCPE
jgi:hypothetical protein